MRGAWSSGNTTTDWIEFFDPEDNTLTYRVNATFLLSNWGCLFGKGCPGLLNRGVDYERGCCERGVSFSSDEDFENVSNAVKQLTKEDWDFAGEGYDDSWYLTRKDKPYATKKKRDRCIFSNMKDAGKSGKSGCAFYALAERTGQDAEDLMPGICWGVPVMSDEEMDHTRDILTVVITANDADDWGGEAPEDVEGLDRPPHMGWWCMDTPDAFQHTGTPFYVSYEKSLRKDFGDSFYEGLLLAFKERGWDQERPASRMAGEVVNDGRPLLPLLIENAQKGSE